MDKSGVQESAPVWSFLAVTEVWPDILILVIGRLHERGLLDWSYQEPEEDWFLRV